LAITFTTLLCKVVKNKAVRQIIITLFNKIIKITRPDLNSKNYRNKCSQILISIYSYTYYHLSYYQSAALIRNIHNSMACIRYPIGLSIRTASQIIDCNHTYSIVSVSCGPGLVNLILLNFIFDKVRKIKFSRFVF
jgi:hypothetical protein